MRWERSLHFPLTQSQRAYREAYAAEARVLSVATRPLPTSVREVAEQSSVKAEGRKGEVILLTVLVSIFHSPISAPAPFPSPTLAGF